ncbi:hypothetical protein S40293_07626 [Stachybotrys chartarum IBT 40293]|nr:hypothetical protein S40293_07626 [Stachybotrys chartarum IBT 40293]
MMLQLKNSCISSDNISTDATFMLRRARHYMGRLGFHVQAVKELINDGSRVTNLLDTFCVAKVPLPECVAPPQADGHTNLRGIFRRMIQSHDTARWDKIEESLPNLDRLVPVDGLEGSIVSVLQEKKIHTRVHSEVQVLEHFYKNSLQFAANDRFIATSKLACVCCKFYFRHHPARVAELDSHQKVYINWGPINLPGGRDHPDFVAQRQLMGKITHDIREDALEKVFQLTSPWPFHHDSITEIANLEYEANSDLDSTSSTTMDDTTEGSTPDNTAEMMREILGAKSGGQNEPHEIDPPDESSDEDGGAPLEPPAVYKGFKINGR